LQLSFQPLYLVRRCVPFYGRSYLIGDAFDKSKIVIFKYAFRTPDKAKKSEGLAGDVNRRYQCRFSTKLRIEYKADRKRQLGIDKPERLGVTQKFAQRGKSIESERFVMRIDHLSHTAELYHFGVVEGGEGDTHSS